MAALIPSRYGRHEVVGPLATGGMADLYLARARGPSGFESLAVVKRIRPHLAANPEFVRLFVGEARLAAQLRHPNVVSVYDAGTEDGEYYFVMEFVHGRDLRALIDAVGRRQRLVSFDEAMSIATGLCAGLHHAHERHGVDGQPLGIVHRDISPSNVLVSYEGAVKLADFGIAKATQLAQKEPGTNTLRGKLSYMSPEQCLGEPLDRRSDLYSLAVVLYELTTGERPHGFAASEFVAMQRRIEGKVRLPSELRPDYPRDLERIVMRGLERHRELRYPTARDMQIDLEAFARAHQLALSPMTLARMMEELFGDELEAWQVAHKAGTSLEAHVTASRTLSVGDAAAQTASGGDAAVVVKPPAPARRRRPMALAAAVALVTAGAIALMLLAWPSRRHAATTPVATTPVATMPVATMPVTITPSATTMPPTASPVATAAARVRSHPAKRIAKRPARATSWDPEAAVLPH